MTATEPQTTRTLRAALLGLAALGTLATPVELLLLRHTASKDQLIPFFLLGLALVGIPLVWFRPNATNLRFFQVSMVLVTLGSLIGIYEHVKGNLAISLHGMGHLTGAAALWDALVNGYAPVLAPGVLAQVGLLGLAFVYRHPAWADARQRVRALSPSRRSL